MRLRGVEVSVKLPMRCVGLLIVTWSLAACSADDAVPIGTASLSGSGGDDGVESAEPGLTVPELGNQFSPSTAVVTAPTLEPLAAPDYASASFDALAVGEVRPTQVWAWCSISIEVGDDRYVPDREIAPAPGREWRESDFPDAWDVAVFNDAPQDGPSWAILDAKVMRIDATSLEVRHIGTNTLIAYFLLDDTPPDQRIC